MVSWAGRLTPDASSRRRCQFGVLAVGGGLCECRYGGARWFLRGPAGQWRLHFEARGQGIDGTLRHPFLIIKVEQGHLTSYVRVNSARATAVPCELSNDDVAQGP